MKLIVLSIAFLASLPILLIFSDYSDEEVNLLHYCEMVELHKQNPDVGWPDFRDTYEKGCPHSKKIVV